MWLLLFIILAGLLIGLSGLRVVQQYERGVIFILGRLTGAKGPGLFWIVPFISSMQKVDLRIVTLNVPPQEVITRDNITIRVTAVIYFYVVDPIAAVVNVMNFLQATTQIGQTTLRNVLGQSDLDEILAQRQKINQKLQEITDEHTERWGVKVTVVETKDIELPAAMQRAMARRAEVEREKRAKIIHKEWISLSRAVASQGNTLDFMLSPTRDAQAAKRFFLKTRTASHSSEPRVINVDKNAAYPKAFQELKGAGRISENCELRQVKYLHNLIEQDHRFLKRLTKPGMAFFSLETAWRTLQGYEIIHMIRKGQMQGVGRGDTVGQVALVAKVFGVAASMQRKGHSMLILFSS